MTTIPTIEIESNVPVPLQGAGRRRIYPFDELKQGQSFFVAGKTASDLSPCKAQAMKRTGNVFTTRTVNGGVRVWRIKKS